MREVGLPLVKVETGYGSGESDQIKPTIGAMVDIMADNTSNIKQVVIGDKGYRLTYINSMGIFSGGVFIPWEELTNIVNKIKDTFISPPWENPNGYHGAVRFEFKQKETVCEMYYTEYLSEPAKCEVRIIRSDSRIELKSSFVYNEVNCVKTGGAKEDVKDIIFGCNAYMTYGEILKIKQHITCETTKPPKMLVVPYDKDDGDEGCM